MKIPKVELSITTMYPKHAAQIVHPPISCKLCMCRASCLHLNLDSALVCNVRSDWSKLMF